MTVQQDPKPPAARPQAAPRGAGGRRVARAIIVGAGVGGLSTALTLRQVGIDVAVFEAADQLRRIMLGGGFTLWPNAMRSLQKIGVAEGVEAAGAPFQFSEFWTRDGERLARWPVGEIGQRINVRPTFLTRAALHRELVGAVGEENIQLGAACVGFSQDAEGVTARFADGREERGDLLIGADGIRSALRAQLLGEQPPRYTGYTTWQGLVDFEHDDVPYGTFRLFYGTGTRYLYHHVAPGRLWWLAIANAPEGGRDPEGGAKEQLMERHRGWSRPTPAIIATTPDKTIMRADVYSRSPVKRWGEGRFTLLGDAAHAMPFEVGQGAAQAMEDAIVLARCLNAEPDVPAALRAYEDQRRGRTAEMQRLAWGLGTLGQLANPVACALRNQLVKRTFNGFVWRKQERDLTFEV
jgi:2-polyprenyl-6-methoxyphenol hydroxylase-like FAD-dependent oxidoreductase